MKLITEQIEDIRVLCESLNGRKTYFIEGIFMQANIKNRNGRVYPMPILKREVERYLKESVSLGRATGELGHPNGPGINLDRISHKIVSLKQEGNNFIGKAQILETPCGNIARGLLEGGVQLGVSSRGMGSIKQIQMDLCEVQEDFYLATAADIVAEPSAPEAFVNGIMEGREWVWSGDLIVEKKLEEIKQKINKAPAKKVPGIAIDEFKSFIDLISKK